MIQLAFAARCRVDVAGVSVRLRGAVRVLLLLGGFTIAGGCHQHAHHGDHDHDHGPAASASSSAPHAIAIDAAAHHHAHAHSHDHSHEHSHEHPHDHSHAHGHATADDVPHEYLHPHFDPLAPCVCAQAKLNHWWCGKCNVGYVAGTLVKSDRLFHTLDPHGHPAAQATFPCATCQDMLRSDGFCQTCGIGFLTQSAYFTRLTYGLAQGRALERARIHCAACASSGPTPTWCEKCQRGMVGNVSIDKPEVFHSTAREYAIFLAAIDKSDACHGCASAMVLHRTCPFCLITYE